VGARLPFLVGFLTLQLQPLILSSHPRRRFESTQEAKRRANEEGIVKAEDLVVALRTGRGAHRVARSCIFEREKRVLTGSSCLISPPQMTRRSSISSSKALKRSPSSATAMRCGTCDQRGSKARLTRRPSSRTDACAHLAQVSGCCHHHYRPGLAVLAVQVVGSEAALPPRCVPLRLARPCEHTADPKPLSCLQSRASTSTGRTRHRRRR
jgi:hypothetical protein